MATRTRYGIVLAAAPDSQVFREHVEAVCWGLAELGADVEVLVRPRPDVRNIVIGPQLLLQADPGVRRLPPGSIVWNAEPDVSPFFVRSLPFLGQPDVTVWDYSRRTTEVLRSLGIPARTVPFAWAPTMRTVHRGPPSPDEPLELEPDVDVLFVGSLNARRFAFLQALYRVATRVQVVTAGTYGDARDRWLARARLAVNLHFWDESPNEDPRILHACANGVAVVSEGIPDEPHKEPWARWSGSSSVEDLARLVERELATEGWREQGPRGERAVREIDAATVLREALSETPTPC